MRDLVSVFRGAEAYPAAAPFHPGVRYPEFSELEVASESNDVFDGVRECLRLSGLDGSRFGTADWNPLQSFVKPGQTVLLKPNWVHDSHPRDAAGWTYTVTHGSVIRAVAEYVVKALDGRGHLVLGDAPQTDASFDRIVELSGARSVAEHFASRGVRFTLVDFRREQWLAEGGVIVERRRLDGDPRGCVAFDLAADSHFYGHGGAGRYYGAFYEEAEVNRHHSGGKHEYLLTGSSVECDVFINLPKLKTHKKTGVTISLKNLVGINGDKNWLPHHTEGHPGIGGDQFPSESAIRWIERKTLRPLRRLAVALPRLGPRILAMARRAGARVAGDTETVVRSGNWSGNDTTWRMALDLNAAMLYGDRDGTLREGRRKPYLSFVDGVVAGEGAGPLNPDPVRAGLLAFGTNAADVDATCAWLMGFDPDRLPIVREAYRPTRFPLAQGSWREIRVASNDPRWSRSLVSIDRAQCLGFRPHFGWVGAIERKR